MEIAVSVRDRVPGTGYSAANTLELEQAVLRARDLIRARVESEVRAFNLFAPALYRGLVRPTEAEQTLNGYKLPDKYQINPEAQVRTAFNAFENQGFLLLVDGRQVETLDEELHLTENSEVTFIRLLPLVGG